MKEGSNGEKKLRKMLIWRSLFDEEFENVRESLFFGGGVVGLLTTTGNTFQTWREAKGENVFGDLFSDVLTSHNYLLAFKD